MSYLYRVQIFGNNPGSAHVPVLMDEHFEVDTTPDQSSDLRDAALAHWQANKPPGADPRGWAIDEITTPNPFS